MAPKKRCRVCDGLHGNRSRIQRQTRQGKTEVVDVNEDDFVFLQNGSMTDASSLGSMTSPPAEKTKADSTGWNLWEKLARARPDFGNPAAFNSCIAQSCWESFTSR
jgi:oleate hydratase